MVLGRSVMRIPSFSDVVAGRFQAGGVDGLAWTLITSEYGNATMVRSIYTYFIHLLNEDIARVTLRVSM